MSRTSIFSTLVMSAGFALALSAVHAEQTTAGQSAADERQVLREATRVAGSVMSPFCPGRTLSACPSPGAGAWRREIRQWVAAGVPRAEIVRRLQARSPEVNLVSHQNAIYGWVAPIVGVGLLSLMILVVGRRLMRQRKRGAADDGSGEEAETQDLSAYHELLDAELKEQE